ncbi:GNAT family N-acetyltransferase [Mesonia aestuariivivens]|uniref:GNAT family N-acetyltransferase n=1 Tax=Mesonia aestuariivivens TaxID=2796128 RepID=A0ABS6W3F9_9FLAO|nr:GNAT family N-acetyltransferase [Mesonia aestuariivivens]MBW2962036.1 GNAT family N-acetyltransferase [Mesonia aestuariivivens]
MNLTIKEFTPDLAQKFAQLNLAWLEKFFKVEAHDKNVLNNCEEEIILKGGRIFFAELDKEIVGTFALLKLNQHTLELTKMAVDEAWRGKKIGQFMLTHFQQYAKENPSYQYVLYSSKKLENAIYLYNKYGFEEVNLEDNPPYVRADIKMIYQPNNHNL